MALYNSTNPPPKFGLGVLESQPGNVKINIEKPSPRI